MKLIICSDSHGNYKALQELVDREQPDILLFLGDGERDWAMVDLPRKTVFYAVSGNCDFMAMEPSDRQFSLCGCRIFMTHGHKFGVKMGLSGLSLRLEDAPADVVFYGHTHQPQIDHLNGCIFVCPGSMGYQEERYAVLELQEGSTAWNPSLRRL